MFRRLKEAKTCSVRKKETVRNGWIVNTIFIFICCIVSSAILYLSFGEEDRGEVLIYIVSTLFIMVLTYFTRKGLDENDEENSDEENGVE